jgi:formylglycine-generating enzyme required for sulfatase activity
MALVALLAGCGNDGLPPEGQLLLYVSTDAPIAGDEALFDRLRIEIVPPDQSEPCAGCAREFAVDAALVDRGRASIGVAPEPGAGGYRARLRLYRSGGTAAGEPRPASTLETVVALPVVQAEGIVEVNVTLRTEDVARPQGSLDAPLDAVLGKPPPGLVGSFAPEPVACPRAPADDESCVPGGIFWMGDPQLDLSAAFDLDGELERLVVLSPFYLDRTEVTVASFRASGLAQPLVPGGPSDDPHEAGGSIASCSYTSEPGAFDGLPVNCLSWNRARLYCESLGKRLPTEAELELAMSALGRSPFVWGHEPPRCDDAVFERDDDCIALGPGPEAPGSGVRDRLALQGGEALDLAGNLSEWAADRWNRQDEACWGTGLFVDPLCDLPSAIDGDARSLRGGDWEATTVTLRAGVRSRLHNETQAVSARLGFRCARSAP